MKPRLVRGFLWLSGVMLGGLIRPSYPDHIDHFFGVDLTRGFKSISYCYVEGRFRVELGARLNVWPCNRAGKHLRTGELRLEYTKFGGGLGQHWL